MGTILVNSIAIFLAAYLLDGVRVKDFFHAIFAAILLGILNFLIKPLLLLLTLPLNILTLGLFTLVINAVLLMAVSKMTSGLEIRSFGSAVIFGVLISFIQIILFWLI